LETGTRCLPERKDLTREFLNSLTASNWRDARNALALAYEEKMLPPNKNFQERFWMKVGEIGGEEVAKELLEDGDPCF
jgi:aldehyde:ferredoxin oxidoreductase